MKGSPILAARDVTKAFGPVTVLHGIHLDFHAGEIHAIVGENGAGKSTLMKILSGIIDPSLGKFAMKENRSKRGGRSPFTAHRSQFTASVERRTLSVIMRRVKKRFAKSIQVEPLNVMVRRT